jgi:hypothetical protein
MPADLRQYRGFAEVGGAGWDNVVEFTIYVVHSQDIAKFMAFPCASFLACFPMVLEQI